MPTVRKLVDVEALLVARLLEDPTLVGYVDDAVSTELPRGFPPAGAARVQLFRASGTTADPATGHIERALVQVNVYGSSKAEAWDVFAETYRVLLDSATGALVPIAFNSPEDYDDDDSFDGPVVAYAGAVVTAVERVSGPSWSPDPKTGAPRYTSSFAVTVHPT